VKAVIALDLDRTLIYSAGSAGPLEGIRVIDEDGKVARVRIDDSKLPLVFQESATTAFLRGRFAPGLLDDVPVRSYLRIEVFFESDSTGQAATQPAANSSALAKAGE